MMDIMNWSRSPWSLFDELEALHEEMDRAISSMLGERRNVPRQRYPPLNVWLSQEGLIIDAELPGVDPKAVEITVAEDELTLRGKVNMDGEKGWTTHRSERFSGEFSRTLRLPFRATPGGVNAVYKNGILRITVPRHEDEKPRRVPVEVSGAN